MDTLTDTSATLFSILVYLYLPSDFYITTVPVPCYYTIERGPVYLGELRERVLSITLYTFLHFLPRKRYCVGQDVLDGWKFLTSIPNQLHKLS